MIITLSIPEDENEQTINIIARQGDLAAVNTLPRADFTEFIEAATTMLADLIANPPHIPALSAPEPARYTPPMKIDLNAEMEKRLPQVREAAAAWDFTKSKITIKNMAAHLTALTAVTEGSVRSTEQPVPSEQIVEMALKKLAEEGALHKGRYNQFGPPPPPEALPAPERLDQRLDMPDEALEPTNEPIRAEAEIQVLLGEAADEPEPAE